jgi:hypothetical protein
VFKPTATTRVLGTLAIVSDDPNSPLTTINLQGTGIQATAIATPNPVDFGDVYVGESKTVTLTIHNNGTNALTVKAADFITDTPKDVSADLAPIRSDIPAGGSASVDLTFSPTQMSNDLPGGIRVALTPEQGGELVIPFKGRGTRSIPQLCWQWDGQGMMSCTAEDPSTPGGGTLPVNFPALCDSKVSPPGADGGTFFCGNAPYEMKGVFFVRNTGNVPVKFNLSYNAAFGARACTGMPISPPDFHFSNAPGAGTPTWNESSTELAAGASTPPVTVIYRPTAGCPDEAADLAMVSWTRQGDFAEQLRKPNSLMATLAGRSLLPEAVEHPMSYSAGATALPTAQDFSGVANQGNAAFQVQKVDLYEVVSAAPGAACNGPDAGTFSPCDFANTSSDCYVFAWADGGNPNDGVPITVPYASDGGAGTAKLGNLVFGVHGNPGQVGKCIYAKIKTTDPFHPEIISKIQGTVQ